MILLKFLFLSCFFGFLGGVLYPPHSPKNILKNKIAKKIIKEIIDKKFNIKLC